MIVRTVTGGSKASSALEMSKRLWDSLEIYIRWHDVEGHTASTRRAYRAELSQFISFLQRHGHSMDISEVTSFEILGHLQDMKERGLRPRSIRSRRVAILSFFNWAESWELIPEKSNPCQRIKPPKVPREYKPFLTEDAFLRLQRLCPLNTFVGARRSSMLWLLISTGIRHLELFSLKVADVDWENKGIRVVLGKGQKTRTIPITKQTQGALLRYMSYRSDNTPALWIQHNGKALSYSGIGQDIKRLMVRAGVDAEIKDTMHIFRRTFGGRAVTQGIPREYIQVVGGWENASMLDHYAQGLKLEQNQALEAFRDFEPFPK